jgi:DNA helicase HerA-like ATPase
MHVLIVGITNTGKTTLAFDMAARYIKAGKRIVVLDPDLRREWGVVNVSKGVPEGTTTENGVMTDDPEQFLVICKNSQSCALFIDESGSMIGRYDTQLEWLATQSRKWGHKSHFIMQRGSQVSPTVRNQCSSAFVFKQSPDDAKVLSNNFVCLEFAEAPKLQKGEYIAKIEVDGKPFKSKAW